MCSSVHTHTTTLFGGGGYKSLRAVRAEIAAGIVPVSLLSWSNLFFVYNSYNYLEYLTRCDGNVHIKSGHYHSLFWGGGCGGCTKLRGW